MQTVVCLVVVVVVEEGDTFSMACSCEVTVLAHLGVHSFCLSTEVDVVGYHTSSTPQLFKGPRDDHTLANSGSARHQHSLLYPQAGLQVRGVFQTPELLG